MRKKILQIVMTLALCSLAIFPLSCASKSSSVQIESQVVKVQRGDLTIDITASGNLALSNKKELAFETAGTVLEVLVKEGDSVEEGQVLAKLDTSPLEWERHLLELEKAVKDARDELQAITFKRERYLLELDKAVRDARDKLQAEMESLEFNFGDFQLARLKLKEAQANLKKAEESDPMELDFQLAKLKLEEAQANLEEARGASPEIIAPFAGFITKANVDAGDEVKKGTVATILADPNKFEAGILVSEMDILQVKLGGEARVQVDAMQGISLPAEVAHISPTATIQSGVVNYQVKVEVKSLEEITQAQQQTRQEARQNITSEELPERLKQAIEEGQITQEQAEAMMERMQQAQGGQQGQAHTTIPEGFQLREGMTVTVSIIVNERSNVLLVPNGAITSQGRQTYVQVLSPDGTVEQRTITTGISNWQYTEATDGLSEGEQVIVPQGTTATTTTTRQQRPQGGIMIPGMGPGGR